LKGRALQECRWTRNVIDGHLPIHPCEPHPHNGKLLYLQYDGELPKKSYVNTLRKLTIPLNCLQTFHGRHGLECFFTAASYAELLESARYLFTLPSQGHGGSLDGRRGFQAAYPGTPSRLNDRNSHEYTRPILSHSERTESLSISRAYSDYERQIRFNAADHARNYGATHARPYARRSIGYQTFPVGNGSHDRGPNPWRILLFVAVICVSFGLFYAGYRGILKVAELAANAWQWLKDGIKSIWPGKLYMAGGA
jgi:hypothetical protein